MGADELTEKKGEKEGGSQGWMVREGWMDEER